MITGGGLAWVQLSGLLLYDDDDIARAMAMLPGGQLERLAKLVSDAAPRHGGGTAGDADVVER